MLRSIKNLEHKHRDADAQIYLQSTRSHVYSDSRYSYHTCNIMLQSIILFGTTRGTFESTRGFDWCIRESILTRCLNSTTKYSKILCLRDTRSYLCSRNRLRRFRCFSLLSTQPRARELHNVSFNILASETLNSFCLSLGTSARAETKFSRETCLNLSRFGGNVSKSYPRLVSTTWEQ